MALQAGHGPTAESERALVRPSYSVSYVAVLRCLGPPVNLSMFEGGGERAHYQYRWNCGCVVLELDRRYRIEPCCAHRSVFEGARPRRWRF